MAFKWLKQLWESFFKEEEKDYKGDQDDLFPPFMQQKHGRIESDRMMETKMIHHYPKQGKFRFPLIPDEGETHKKRSQRQERQVNRNEDINPHQKSSRHKFSGENFKAEDIPSPVYGFSERRTAVSFDDKQSDEHNIVAVPSIEKESFPHNEQDGTVVSHLSLVSSEQQDDVNELTHHETDDDYNLHSMAEDADIASRDSQSEGALVTGNGEFDECINARDVQRVNDEVETEMTAHENVENVHRDVPSDERSETEVQEKALQLVDEDVEEMTIVQTELNQDEGAMNGQVEGNDQDIEEEKESVLIKQQQDEDQDKQTKEHRSEEASVPFNVIMLKSDKRNLEAKHAQHERQAEAPKQNLEQVSKFDSGQELTQKPNKLYQFPSMTLLDEPLKTEEDDDAWLEEKAGQLEETLSNFHVDAEVVDATKGPTVTRFEVHPKPGVKVNKITNLSDDIKLSLAARDIRIEAPIPGKNTIGIEVPNQVSQPVSLFEMIKSEAFQSSQSPLTVCLGFNIAGEAVVTDLQKMPHGLIAGATGSGKSVCINSLLASILYKASPDEVKLLLVDPKVVELAPYNGIPHLVTPVITDVKEATMALKWAVEEMEQRYQQFAETGVRNIAKYNEWATAQAKEKMSYIVIVIDELADLMMVSPQDVEDSIARIAQKARACGIHLILATQRPSVDVITGLIKANVPTRIAFAVSSQVDSRTILDTAGAEKLLGRGDMLFLGNGTSKPVRLQGNFVSDEEIDRITEHVKTEQNPMYLIEKDALQKQISSGPVDDLFDEACRFVIEQETASTSSLQRKFRIGYNRAARLIDDMEEKGIVSEAMGSKPRNVLLSMSQFDELMEESSV